MFLCTKLGGTAEVENFCPSIDRTKVFFMHSPVQGNYAARRRTGRAVSSGEDRSPTRLHSPVQGSYAARRRTVRKRR